MVRHGLLTKRDIGKNKKIFKLISKTLGKTLIRKLHVKKKQRFKLIISTSYNPFEDT